MTWNSRSVMVENCGISTRTGWPRVVKRSDSRQPISSTRRTFSACTMPTTDRQHQQKCDYCTHFMRCASGCVVECRTCNREVAGSNLSRGYYTPRSTQRSIHPGSVNEYQLRLGRQRQVWLILLANETQGVQVKLWYPLTMHAIPEYLRDVSCRGAIQIDLTFTLPYLYEQLELLLPVPKQG